MRPTFPALRIAAPTLLPTLLLALLLVLPPRAEAQAREGDRLRVYLDCQTFCDQTHMRTEIDWVDWVRDRNDADVHVLVTGQATGGGGREFTVAFIGRERFQGRDDEIVMATAGDATRDEEREVLVSAVSLGLGPYVASTPGGRRLRVQAREGAGAPEVGGGAPGPGQASPADDPWDFWVFNLGVNGNVNGESSQRFDRLSGSASANRTTEAWKFNFSGRFSRNESRFELSDTTITSVREDWNADGFVVKSLGAQWALGAGTSAGSSTFLNQDLRWDAEAGVEYNFFPYSESTRRELTLQYTVGVDHFRYDQVTLFGETEETRPRHTAAASLDVNQPWGQTGVRLSGSQYLHDTDFYNLSVFASANIRLVRGLSFRITGSYSKVNDQLYIPGGNLTDEEILLRQQALATNYRYFVSFGINYRFGSIFNNVVNPRFGGGGGEIIIF